MRHKWCVYLANAIPVNTIKEGVSFDLIDSEALVW